MATKLSEPKTQLIVGVVELVGRQVALELFDRTRKTESEGGMMIKNGERRRTPGGIFLQLLRDDAATDERIDDKKVKHFFAQCNRPHHQKAKGRRAKEAFGTELELYKKLSLERKKKEEQQEAEMAVDKQEEDEEELKPLPDILSTISKRFEEATKGEASKPSSSTTPAGEVEEGELAEGAEKKLEAFVEPEAPPNSVERVERTISAYDEDEFLNNDTEDIELF